MRIVFLGNFEVDYSSETHHKKSLEALGHEVIALQERAVSSEIVLKNALSSDMFVWVHTHGWVTQGTINMQEVLQTLRRIGIPTVTYHLDLWFGLQREKDLETDPIYKSIEYFFTCDKLMADWFNEKTEVKGVYLPAGVFQDDMKLDLDAPKTKDVIFVGSKGYHHEWPYRPELINWLRATYGDRFTHVGGDGDTGTVRGEALTQLYNQAKVVVGDSLVLGFDYPYYWSDRLYETAGRGGFQIFPYIKGIEDQYNINMASHDCELITYEFGEWTQLKEKIDWFLSDEGSVERDRTRKNAYERTLKDHTYLSRWQTILDKIQEDKDND